MFDVIKEYGLEDGFEGNPILRNIFVSMVSNGPDEFFAFLGRVEKFFAFFENAYLKRSWTCKVVEFEDDTWEPMLPEGEKGFLIDDLSSEICLFKDSFSQSVPDETVEELIDIYVEYEKNVLSPMRDGYGSTPYNYGRIVLEAKMAGYEKKDRLNYLLNVFCEEFVYVFFEWSFDLDAPSAWQHILNTYDAYDELVLRGRVEKVVDKVYSSLEGFRGYSQASAKKGFYGELETLLDFLKKNETISDDFYQRYHNMVRNSDIPGYRIFYKIIFVGLDGLGSGISKEERRDFLRNAMLGGAYGKMLERGRSFQESKVVDWVLKGEEKDDAIRNLGLKDGLDGQPIMDGLFLSMLQEGPKDILSTLCKLEKGFVLCNGLFDSKRLQFEEVDPAKDYGIVGDSPNLEGGFVHYKAQKYYVLFDKMTTSRVSDDAVDELVEAYLEANSKIVCPILSFENMPTDRCRDDLFKNTMDRLDKNHKVNYLFNFAAYVSFNDFFGRWYMSSYSAFDYVRNTLNAYLRKVLFEGMEKILIEALSALEGFEGLEGYPETIQEYEEAGERFGRIGLKRAISKKVFFPFRELRVNEDVSVLRPMYKSLFDPLNGIAKDAPEDVKRRYLEHMVQIRAILSVHKRYEALKGLYLYRNSMGLE